jgi:hypothetical protein
MLSSFAEKVQAYRFGIGTNASTKRHTEKQRRHTCENMLENNAETRGTDYVIHKLLLRALHLCKQNCKLSLTTSTKLTGNVEHHQ